MGKRSRERMSGLAEEQRVQRAEELRKKKVEEQAKLDIAVVKALLEEKKKIVEMWAKDAVIVRSKNTPDEVKLV